MLTTPTCSYIPLPCMHWWSCSIMFLLEKIDPVACFVCTQSLLWSPADSFVSHDTHFNIPGADDPGIWCMWPCDYSALARPYSLLI